ncbi:tigger transposable element-derived protein 6-like [Frankliniella occidentalis]|uniref:Tigger transposable element-derived protein 6-like n=1 Tax=Frankliniella occidentalis TaxID=133901 RepID=A0A9C6X7T5_FRAOC|nr:tigger transposable element-derived protein 6-like [Frankliniella occidentalis]
MIKGENYDLDDVYNMDETGICWKSLPKKTLIHAGERGAEGGKIKKDRFTAAMCANATGTHRLPLLVIGKYQNPRCFKHVVSLPVHYRWQKSSWITSVIFSDWLLTFKRLVERHQAKNGRSGKVLLLVDNCAAHNTVEGFDFGDKFKLVFLPPNTTSLIQPMDQGVIVKVKRLFQGKFLRKVLQCKGGIVKFYDDYDMKDAIDMLVASWNELTPDNLRRAWNNIMPFREDRDITKSLTVEPDNDEDWTELIQKIDRHVTVADVHDWMEEKEKAEEEVTGDDTEDSDIPELEYDDDSNVGDDVNDELETAFRVVLKWAEKHRDEHVKTMVETLYSFFNQ